MEHHDARRRAAVAVAVLVLRGCAPAPSKSVPATSSSMRLLGAAGCHPASPVSSNEVQGTPDGDVMVWGLMFGVLQAGEQVKIVWRMTGSGDLTVVPFGPDGAARRLVFGPDHHTSSSYHRPGEEWGTGFVWDEAGCWRIQLARTKGRPNVYFDVKAKLR